MLWQWRLVHLSTTLDTLQYLTIVYVVCIIVTTIEKNVNFFFSFSATDSMTMTCGIPVFTPGQTTITNNSSYSAYTTAVTTPRISISTTVAEVHKGINNGINTPSGTTRNSKNNNLSNQHSTVSSVSSNEFPYTTTTPPTQFPTLSQTTLISSPESKREMKEDTSRNPHNNPSYPFNIPEYTANMPPLNESLTSADRNDSVNLIFGNETIWGESKQAIGALGVIFEVAIPVLIATLSTGVGLVILMLLVIFFINKRRWAKHIILSF